MPRPPYRSFKLGEGSFRQQSGHYRARQNRPTAPYLTGDDLGEHRADCWVEFVGDEGGPPTKLAFQARPAPFRGGRTDLRVYVPPLGGHVTFTRVLALAFLRLPGRRKLTWRDLQAEVSPGIHRLAVRHIDDNPHHCELGNLAVGPAAVNAAQERRGARAGRRPARGPDRFSERKRRKEA